MANFFDDADIVYCLCIEERKDFVIDQFKKLGYTHKLKIFDAYTPDSDIVKQTIINHRVYPIYTNNPVSIACSLGIQHIMIDIVQNEYNFAYVIEDDVIFLEKMLEHGNKWLTKNVISKTFDINKPYVLYLQSTAHENSFYRKGKLREGIVKTSVRYGEPAYITNHVACSLLLRHFFMITSPFDEYKFVIKNHYNIQEGILIPYICRELSYNIFGYDSSALKCKFTRSGTTKKNTVFDIFAGNVFNVTTDENIGIQKIMLRLIEQINPSIKIVINDKNIDKMIYCMGKHELNLNGGYYISCTFSDNVCKGNNSSFIISVRGKKSQNIVFKKFGIKTYIGDVLSLYSKYNPKSKNIINKYCFIFENAVSQIVSEHRCVYINPNSSSINIILETMCSSQYVVSNNINYLSIAKSYDIFGIYASINSIIDVDNDIIAQDYFSNFTDNRVNPVNITLDKNIIFIDQEFIKSCNNFLQPINFIDNENLNTMLDIIPFNFKYHNYFRKDYQYVQIIN